MLPFPSRIFPWQLIWFPLCFVRFAPELKPKEINYKSLFTLVHYRDFVKQLPKVFRATLVHRDPPDEEEETLKGWGGARIFWVRGGVL